MFLYLYLNFYFFMNTTPINSSESDLVKRAKTLRTIAHPVRLQIIKSLGVKKSLTVSALKKTLVPEIEQSMLSHHLIKMKDNGILRSKKVGKFNHYSLSDIELLKVI